MEDDCGGGHGYLAGSPQAWDAIDHQSNKWRWRLHPLRIWSQGNILCEYRNEKIAWHSAPHSEFLPREYRRWLLSTRIHLGTIEAYFLMMAPMPTSTRSGGSWMYRHPLPLVNGHWLQLRLRTEFHWHPNSRRFVRRRRRTRWLRNFFIN